MNNLKVNDDNTLELENTKYVTIGFEESVDSYIVHYNKESPFNFDTHDYYVVKKMAYSIRLIHNIQMLRITVQQMRVK